MGIQSDLLLLAAGGIHQWVGVEIAALGVDMSNRYSAAQDNISSNVLHAFAVQGRLELGAHEAITIARVDKAEEVDGEHGHVEGERDDDESKSSGNKVLGPQAL